MIKMQKKLQKVHLRGILRFFFLSSLLFYKIHNYFFYTSLDHVKVIIVFNFANILKLM